MIMMQEEKIWQGTQHGHDNNIGKKICKTIMIMQQT